MIYENPEEGSQEVKEKQSVASITSREGDAWVTYLSTFWDISDEEGMHVCGQGWEEVRTDRH